MIRKIDNPDISAIVVIGQRQDDLKQLIPDYWNALEQTDKSFEFICVLDGQQQSAAATLSKLRADGMDIRIVKLSRAFGEATALMSGFDLSNGSEIITLPAYYQVDPAELNKLIESAGNDDVILAHRDPRRGGWFEKLRRDVFHKLLAAITGYRFRDLGCGVRALRRRVLDELRLYGDQHRFLPVLARNAGFQVSELDVKQSDHDAFRSRYRIREYLHRLLDIFTVFFLVRFTKKPLRFFGMIGSTIFVVGALILTVLVFERLFLDIPLADRPAMLLSSLLVVLGLQLFSLGLLGELIIFTHARSLKEYKIDQIIGGEPKPAHGDREEVKDELLASRNAR